MERWIALLKEAQTAAQTAQAIWAKHDGKMPPSELALYEAKHAEAMRLKAESDQAKKDGESQALLKELAEHDGDAPEHPETGQFGTKAPASGSTWARQVQANLTKAAGISGVKALLTGEITTPPGVDVVQLPKVAHRVLDLVGRETLTEHTFSFLRQVSRTMNADVVADGATKPTSVFEFEEIEDRARVVAHLSEPFPLRYLDDHRSVISVLDSEMLTGLLDKLEQQLMSGTGTGEEFQGLLTTTGVTAVPFATDKLTTIRKARTALAVKGEQPNAWVINPTDAEEFDLMREDGATGGFLMDSAAADTVFGQGISRVLSLSVPAGTAVLGDWRQLSLGVRQGAHTLAATQAGDLFDKNQVKLRSEGRFGIKNRRPQAFAVVDLTAA